MRLTGKSDFYAQVVTVQVVLCCTLLVSGCGMPAAPHPPSLNLPEPVADLSATRTGNSVSLTWTMPKRDTDKVLLKGQIAARVCRRISDTGACDTVAILPFAPAADAAFTETLPHELAEGTPRALSYFVELNNKARRSAGLSNPAVVVAGMAPAAVSGLSAELRKDGVVLHWTPGGAETIRLNRKLVAPPAASGQPAQTKAAQGILAPPPIPVEQNLLVETGAASGRLLTGVAIDRQIQFGQTYEYRAQRVASVTVNGKTMELNGEFSAPLRVDATESFPPEAPTGLAAVAEVGENGAETAIDLSWQPNTEEDVGGYAVYRRESSLAAGLGAAWQRISPTQPVVGPGYHDAAIQRGHTYEYAVTAINRSGHESAKSEPTRETVPTL
jgi:hypothetical protein